MKLKIFLSFVLILLIAISAYLWIFNIPKQPQVITFNKSQLNVDWNCYKNPNLSQSFTNSSLDEKRKLNLVIWNIHKQDASNWQSTLESYGKSSQLMMLQESSFSKQFQQWLSSQSWIANQVIAFKIFDDGVGVLNLSSISPTQACAQTAVEPWIRLPKSSLYAYYPLSNKQSLLAVNIHSINFALGVSDFQQQLLKLAEKIKNHQGPVVMGGDFNTWSDERLQMLQQLMSKLSLQEVVFKPDNRLRVMNDHYLDHAFYRGLTLNNASSPTTTASDHNPMIMSFELIN